MESPETTREQDGPDGDLSRPLGSTFLVIVAIVNPETLKTGWRVIAEYTDKSTAEKLVELNPNLTMRVLEDKPKAGGLCLRFNT